MKICNSNRRPRNRRTKIIFILVILNITIHYYLISFDDNLNSNNSIKTSSFVYDVIPQICSDGSGGAIITSESYDKCFVQYVNSSGDIQWEENGILINPDVRNYYNANTKIISDDVGGSIVATSTDNDLLVMRLNSSGDVQWNVEMKPYYYYNSEGYQICSDGANGIIIAWVNGDSIYAQKVNASGDIQWGENGIAICDAPGDQEYPVICSDSDGGAIIAWEDRRSGEYGTDIYAQRINASGDIQWNENGVAICIADNYQSSFQICNDNANGVIIIWEDYRNSEDKGYPNYNSSDIYTQRINASGNIQWKANGIVICNASDHQGTPKVCSDGDGGAIIVWEDDRSGDYGTDVYVQSINSSGKVLWKENGVILANATTYIRKDIDICIDGGGGVIITWEDHDSIYAQRINSLGDVQWKENGIIIGDGNAFPGYLDICYDENGGAIISWQRGWNGHIIYAQRLNSSGDLLWGEKGVIVYRDHSGPIAPLGSSYILFMVIGIFLLIIIVKRKISYKNK